jgi:hypothetical protein
MATWTCRLLAVVAALFLLMWPIGHIRYTSVGLDRETLMDGDLVQMDYYRVRWPGNGDV